MAHYCWTCGNEVYFDVKVGIKVGRHDGCPHCGADMKVCKNCQNYDPGVHNQCRETTAEFIRDRERANFCTHFVFRDSDGPQKDDAQEAARAKLDALFKNFK
jgi:predicted  nucleic acid-binding Zn-ribbon protein